MRRQTKHVAGHSYIRAHGLYAALDLITAFAETVVHEDETEKPAAPNGIALSVASLEARRVVTFRGRLFGDVNGMVCAYATGRWKRRRTEAGDARVVHVV